MVIGWLAACDDTIRYDTVYLHVLKIWQDGQLSLAHDIETKNKEKLKTKTRVAGKKRSGQVREHSLKKSEATGVGLVRNVGFKLGVKDRGSYGWTEW